MCSLSMLRESNFSSATRDDISRLSFSFFKDCLCNEMRVKPCHVCFTLNVIQLGLTFCFLKQALLLPQSSNRQYLIYHVELGYLVARIITKANSPLVQ